MFKKLITACMAIAAFAAFVVPSTASALNDPTLTDVNGEPGVGAKIVGTNVGETLFTNTDGSFTQVRCSTAYMTGEVVKNSGGTVEGTITTSDFSGTEPVSSHNGLNECTSSFGGGSYITVTEDLCIRSTPTMVTDEFQVHRGKCGGEQKKVEFVIGSTTLGPCEYRATGNIKGDYTTGGEHATLTVRNNSAGSGAEKISGSFFCPTSGSLKMTFTLETEDGTPVTIS